MHNRIALFLVFVSLSGIANAQDIFSPLSTQGVGQLRNNLFIHNLSMGGVATAFTRSDSNAYSLKNPATSSYLKYTALDFGIKTGFNQVVSNPNTNRGTFDDYGLDYMSLAFVANKKRGWTMSFGIAPFSAFGYEIVLNYNDTFKYEEHVFKGGISEFYFNNAFRLLSNKDKVKLANENRLAFEGKKIDSVIKVPHLQILTAGLQGSYLFGSKSYEHNVYFPNETDLAAVRTLNNYLIRGFTYKLGLHYKLKDLQYTSTITNADSSKKEVINFVDFDFGAYFGSSTNNRATLERHATSFFVVGGNTTVPDTVLPMQRSVGAFKLPNSIGAGFMFTKKDNWRIGFDIDYTQWSNFSYAGLTSKLNDELMLCLGGSYTPKSDKKFLQRMEYRGGFNYRQSFLNQNNKQLNGYSTTFGVGLPFGKTIKSSVNFGFELGTLGNRKDNIFEERYYNMYLGITVNEFWFQKQKEK